MSEEIGCRNKVAVITGGAKGLGKAISLAFVRAGASVAIISRTKGDLEKIENEIKKISLKDATAQRVVTFCGDISKEKNVKEFISKVVNELGRIDFLVNNAATYLEKKIDETSFGEWDSAIKVNLTGTFFVTREVVKQMKAQKAGHIFTISSVGGRIGLSGKTAYCASKFGVTGFSKALAKELKEFNIKVQIVYPYYVDSYGEIDWTKEEKKQLSAIKPEEIADIVIYQASLPLRILTEDIIFESFMR